jgi:hypothetical protein
VKIEESIRGCDVFLIQPTSPPVNDHLMELLIMIDACRRASARSVTVRSSVAAARTVARYAVHTVPYAAQCIVHSVLCTVFYGWPAEPVTFLLDSLSPGEPASVSRGAPQRA